MESGLAPSLPPAPGKLKINLPILDLAVKKKSLPQAPEKPLVKTNLDLQKKEIPLPLPKKEPIPIPTKSLIVHANSSFKLPSPDMLANPSNKIDQPTLKKDLMRQAAVLEETLKSFGIEAKVGEINSGPTITSFEVHPSIGVKVQKIKTLENDIALNMQAKSIRIVAPIPGKAAVGVEVPAIHPQEVNFKEMLLYYQQKNPPHANSYLAWQSGERRLGLFRFSQNAAPPHRRRYRIG